METKKHMKAIHGNVTFQCDQCNYKANKPKINYCQKNWYPVYSVIETSFKYHTEPQATNGNLKNNFAENGMLVIR